MNVRLITAGVVLTNFLVALEATVVSTAAPTIVQDLGGMSLYAWVFTAYMITVTVSGPIWGKLSDLYGRRRIYLVSVALFLAGSALSGQAHSMAWLIGFRALQGLGGGALTPLGQTVLAEIYSLKDRARMQAMITMIFGVASILGPLVGGYLTQHANWRWIFYLNLPFGLAGVALLALTLPAHQAGSKVKFDLAGSLLFSAALTFALLWSEGVPHWQTSDPRLWGGALLALALFGAFLRLEARHPDPLLPPALFRLRMFSAGSILMTLVGMTLYGAITYIPLFYQSVLKATPSEAGKALSPLLFTWIAGSMVSSKLILKAGYRITVGIGVIGFLLAYLLLANAGPLTPTPELLLAAVLVGVGGGFTIAPLVIGVQSVVDKPQLGAATSEILFFRSVGGSVGVTLMGVAMNASQKIERAFDMGLVFCVAALAAWFLLPPGNAEAVEAKGVPPE